MAYLGVRLKGSRLSRHLIVRQCSEPGGATLSREMRVLLVEDEPMIALLFEDALFDAGFDAVVAADGSFAFDILKNEPLSFDGLITDIRMPGIINGWDVARKFRELNPAAAVVYMTGDSMTDWRDHGVERSVLHHKPVPVDEVLGSLTQLLRDGA